MAVVLVAIAVATGAQTGSLTLPEGQDFTSPERMPFSLSADGTQLTYIARASLFVTTLRGGEPTLVCGPVEARGKSNPIFTPDGGSIVYWAQDDSVLERVPARGGAPVRVARVANPLGMSWAPDGQLLVGQGAEGIVRVPAGGGAPQRVVTLAAGETALGPQMLPDGDTVLFTLGRGRPVAWTVVTQSIRTGRRTTIVPGSNARYVPDGALIYVTGTTVVAWQVWLRPYPATGARFQVTTAGGRSPSWLPDGRLVFEHDGAISSVTLPTGTTPTFGQPVRLPVSGFFQPLPRRSSWDVTPDGRFLMLFRDGPSLDILTGVMDRLQNRR